MFCIPPTSSISLLIVICTAMTQSLQTKLRNNTIAGVEHLSLHQKDASITAELLSIGNPSGLLLHPQSLCPHSQILLRAQYREHK
jgi:hypothetical protein